MDEKRDSGAGSSVLTLGGASSTVKGLRAVAPVVRAAAFWGAICLPWIALFLLFTGLATSHPIIFTLVVVAASVATLAGHDHPRR